MNLLPTRAALKKRNNMNSTITIRTDQDDIFGEVCTDLLYRGVIFEANIHGAYWVITIIKSEVAK